MRPQVLSGRLLTVAPAFAAVLLSPLSRAQETPSARPDRRPPPPVASAEVTPDKKLVLRLRAPEADKVEAGGDLPGSGFGRALPLTKGAEGVWEAALGPFEPGSYRYTFLVDGVPVVDPRNPLTSQSNDSSSSLVHIPGAEFMDTQEVPRGAISEVSYYSTVLKRDRRMHVYTPPGYEAGNEAYPVFYLLHGAMDSDDSWSTVGRAGVILDNLMATGKTKPMVVVMPHGHTGPFRFGMGFSDDFEREFVTDIMPQVEKRYRLKSGRAHRALAGLSMGGAQTLNIGIPKLGDFAYLGVFSSGVFGLGGGPGGGPGGGNQGPSFEEKHASVLDDASLKEGLKLCWFATGKDDFLVRTSQATVEMLKKHGFAVTYHETDGGHTWDKWREYLAEFAPQLFQP